MRGLVGRSAPALVALALTFTAACGTTPAGPGAPDDGRPPTRPATRPLIGRAAIDRISFPPLRFNPPPTERRTLASGAPVLVVEDRTLPLVEVMVRFKGGPSYFGRERLGAASAASALLRSGGTRSLPADSVDALIDFHAWRMGFGVGGTTSFATVGALRRDVAGAVHLWAEMLREPRFDRERVEVWRGRELESVQRRRDDPNFDAVTRFNRLLYGDHPVGWVMEPADLEPADLTRERLSAVHAAVYCPGNATFGVAGDISADSAVALLDEAFAGWAPCAAPLGEPPTPDVRSTPGVFVLHRPLSQTTIYMGHGGGVSRADGDDYFASRIANSILGGSGLSSRLVRTVRTELGLAYGAGTVWTTPRDHEGAFAAFTQTRADATVAAARTVLGVVDGLRDARPGDAEVRRAIDEIANGFVFNFSSSARVVARRMLYEAEGLGPDWLERYVEGIQRVNARDVQRVARTHIHPSRMTLLVIGDTTAFDAPLRSLGLGEPVLLSDDG
ncbi:MAG: pitrilysin family protein [Gemmatimonadota bacterium]